MVVDSCATTWTISDWNCCTRIPIPETVKALVEMVAEGLIGGIQLTEVNAETIRQASAVGKIDMVETEINMWATQAFDNGAIDACAKLSIVVVARKPLGAGILTRKSKSIEDLVVPQYYRSFPRCQPDFLDKIFDLVTALDSITAAKGCTSAQLVLTWIRGQSRKPGRPAIIPVPGASSVERAVENAKVVELTDEDLSKIDAILGSFEE